MRASCIIVTMGDRPADLARAIASVLAQEAAPEVLVVANGCPAPEVPPQVEVLTLAENLGPAGARNLAAARARGDILFFLDDDTSYPDREHVTKVLACFDREPSVAVLSFRVDDPGGAPPQRRHVPRLRAGDRERSSDVTTFLEGACAIRRAVFLALGGYPEGFFFGHEGTDLAWRAIDAGHRVRYAGDLVVHHPAAPATRHDFHHRMTARNRVFLARRLLPWPLVPLYLGTWLVLGLARAGSARAAREVIGGFVEGARGDAGPRSPISWRAVWRMTAAGRPPLV